MQLVQLPHLKLAPAPASCMAIVFTDQADKAEFFTYPPEERQSVAEYWSAFTEISRVVKETANVSEGVRRVARNVEGWRPKYLRKLYDEWEATGRDWRYLVNGDLFPEARKPMLSPETEAWVAKELLKNQRKFAPCIKAIHARWRQWFRTQDPKFAIPGFVDELGQPKCPPPDAGYLPRPLLKHNLMKVKPAKPVVEMVRYGTQAAMALLPGIPGTREGARWLEHVSCDDVWLDVRSDVPGYGPCRVLQFGAWEYSCSYYDERTFIQRPRTKRDDGSWEQLCERDFLWFTGMFFEKHGWPVDWTCNYLCENGTATLTAGQARFLEEISEGHIKVHFNRMEGETMLGWKERMRGNSKAKAGHEGCHGIIKNEMAHLIGQTGKDPEHAPALDYGREQAMHKLDNLRAQLPASEQSCIIGYYLSPQRVWQETFDALKRIHRNADHKCEGFETVREWRPRNFTHALPAPNDQLAQWLAGMPQVNADNIAEYVEFFYRPETREERKARLCAQGRFMAPPSGVMSIFYEDRMEVRRIGQDGSFSFEKAGKKYRFLPPTPGELKPGTKVCGFCRPDGEVIHLFSGDETGRNRRYLLTWPSEGKLRRDADAGTKAMFHARKREHFNHTYEIATRATEEQIAEVRAAHENNLQVFAENGLITREPNVNVGLTDAARAVAGVHQERIAGAKRRTAAREVDVVKETIRRSQRAKKKADAADAWA